NHWEANSDLPSYLSESGVPGIQGIDTRALVRHLRSRGTMRAVLRFSGAGGFKTAELETLKSLAATVTELSHKSLVAEVSGAGAAALETGPPSAPRVAVIDYGIKQ